MSLYWDEYGVMVTSDSDGGDSCNKTMLWDLGKYWVGEPVNLVIFEHHLQQFEVSGHPGLFRRHPDPNKWYYDPRTFSRDQTVPLIIALGAYRYPRELFDLWLRTMGRFGFAQNTHRSWGERGWKIPDWLSPEHWALFLRAFSACRGTFPLWPLFWLLLWGCDLVSVLAALIPQSLNPQEVDDHNRIAMALAAITWLPTPLSWLARRIYARNRPINLGNLLCGEANAVQGALTWYYREDSGGNPAMAELYRPLIAKYFGGSK